MEENAKQPDKMSRRDVLAVTVSLLFVLLVWAGLSIMFFTRTDNVSSRDGVIDLRGFDFENGIFTVAEEDAGNWESWAQALYTPRDFAAGITGAGRVLGPEDYASIEYVTHRRTLLLNPGKLYGISMITALYAQRLFIGGEEIGSAGVPAVSRDEFVPGTLDATYFFIPQTERVDIIVQAANFVHGRTACRPPGFSLGYAENINALNRRQAYFSAIVLGCLLTSFMYHLALFLLNRKRTPTLLFSVCCLLLALMDKKLLHAFFPDITWYVEIRYEYIVLFLTLASVSLFVQKQFPKLMNKTVIYAYCAYALLFCFTVFFDTRFFTLILHYFQAATVIIFTYVVIRFAMSLKSGEITYVLGFAGILVMILLAVNDILLHGFGVNMFTLSGQVYTVPFGMVFFVFCYAILIAVEYAETKRREEALAEHNEFLERLNRQKTQFLQDMSHEMKAPLTVIATGIDYTDSQLNKAGDIPKAVNALDTIRNETQRLGRMVGGMVDLAAMGEARENRKRVDFNALLINSAEAFRITLAERNNTLHTDIAPGLPEAYVEEDRFMQVMANLLSNASRHTEKGNIFLRAVYDRSYITVSLSDSGQGIQPETLPHVFERGVSGGEGTGYGLFLCKTVVEAHGGVIDIESVLKLGTKVTFTVPVYGGQEAGHKL